MHFFHANHANAEDVSEHAQVPTQGDHVMQILACFYLQDAPRGMSCSCIYGSLVSHALAGGLQQHVGVPCYFRWRGVTIHE